jgi:hypothetical protein
MGPKPPGGRCAERHRSGDCSTDWVHLVNMTLVCDASGAATVAVGLVVGERKKRARERAGGMDSRPNIPA